MSQLRRYLEAGTSRITEQALLRGRAENILVVNEYPKSGGTWIAKMIASLVDRPFTDNRTSIPRSSVVMRTHWDPTELKAGVYVVRDGRDVMVSLFHHRCRRVVQDPQVASQVNSVYPFAINADKIVEQLPKFIEVEMTTRTAGSPLSWKQHVLAGIGNDALQIVRYEDMLVDAATALKTLGEALLSDVSVTDERASAVAMLHDRRNALSATHGMGRSAIRSASAGEWRDVFSDEATDVYNAHCADVIQELGYDSE